MRPTHHSPNSAAPSGLRPAVAIAVALAFSVTLSACGGEDEGDRRVIQTQDGGQMHVDQPDAFVGSGQDARVPRPGDPDMGMDPPPDRPDMGGGPPPDRPDMGMDPPPDRPDMGMEPPPDLPPDPRVNAGWIGGPCDRDEDCDYEEAFCLADAEGYPRGQCSLDCDQFCPDRDGMPVTFCIDGVVAGNGACVQRCDYTVFEEGCRPGYHCETRGRYGDANTRRGVCIPGPPPDMPPPGMGGCYDQLDALGIVYDPAQAPNESPANNPGLQCTIDQPILLHSPIAGVSYRYVESANARPMYMGCHLGLAIHQLSLLLREYGIVEVGHIGTYHCRAIAGTNTLSQHGLGNAIDIAWFRTEDGTEYNLVRHWEHDTNRPRTEAARILYEIGQQMFARQIFNIVLTPNYNAAHDNHFHVDLTAGGRFIGKGDGEAVSDYFIGPNPHGD